MERAGLRIGIDEAQTSGLRKSGAPKASVGGGGRSPRGKARTRLEFGEDEGQPLRKSSSSRTKRASGNRIGRERDSDVEEEEEEEEEEEPRKRGKKGESTDSDDGEELQPAGPSPKKKKQNPKKGRL